MTAGHGGIRQNLDKYGVISTESHDVGKYIPEDLRAAYVNESDRVGAMLGLEDTRTLAGEHAAAAPVLLHPCASQPTQATAGCQIANPTKHHGNAPVILLSSIRAPTVSEGLHATIWIPHSQARRRPTAVWVDVTMALSVAREAAEPLCVVLACGQPR